MKEPKEPKDKAEEKVPKKVEGASAEKDSGEGVEGGVTVPEEFQKDTHALMQKATTKHHLNHIRDRVNEKDNEMREKDEMNMEGAPSSL